jgi:hypothetical protein
MIEYLCLSLAYLIDSLSVFGGLPSYGWASQLECKPVRYMRIGGVGFGPAVFGEVHGHLSCSEAHSLDCSEEPAQVTASPAPLIQK